MVSVRLYIVKRVNTIMCWKIIAPTPRTFQCEQHALWLFQGVLKKFNVFGCERDILFLIFFLIFGRCFFCSSTNLSHLLSQFFARIQMTRTRIVELDDAYGLHAADDGFFSENINNAIAPTIKSFRCLLFNFITISSFAPVRTLFNAHERVCSEGTGKEDGKMVSWNCTGKRARQCGSRTQIKYSVSTWIN